MINGNARNAKKWCALGGMLSLLPVVALAQRIGKTPKAEEEDGWGKAHDGLQVGLVLKDKKTAFRYGETLHFALRVRNTGDKRFEAMVKTTHRPFYSLVAGNQIRFDILFGDAKPFQINAGEEKTLTDADYAVTLVPPDESPVKAKDNEPNADKTFLGLLPGKYSIHAPMPLWVADNDDNTRATGLRASTGKVSFEVVDPLEGLRPNRTPPPRFDPILKMIPISWGEPVNGLQSGLAIAPVPNADKNSAAFLGLTFFVRNITTRPMRISYPNFQEYDWSPMVKNAKGEAQEVSHVFVSGLRGMLDKTLQPNEIFAMGNTRLRCIVSDKKAEGKDDLTPTLTAPAGKYTVSLMASVRFQGLDRLDMVLISADVPFTLPLPVR